MTVFNDSTGRQWQIKINIGIALALKDRLGLDILNLESEYKPGVPMITVLFTDEYMLAEAILETIKPQITGTDLTESDIRSAFDGETLAASQKAFVEELLNFFRSRGRIERAEQVMKMAQALEIGIAQLTTMVKELDIEAEVSGVISGELPEL